MQIYILLIIIILYIYHALINDMTQIYMHT